MATRVILSPTQKRQGEPVINHHARWLYSDIQMWRRRSLSRAVLSARITGYLRWQTAVEHF